MIYLRERLSNAFREAQTNLLVEGTNDVCFLGMDINSSDII
jgi:hypothetical protein